MDWGLIIQSSGSLLGTVVGMVLFFGGMKKDIEFLSKTVEKHDKVLTQILLNKEK